MSNQKAKKKKKVNETITIAVEVAGKTKTLKVGLKDTIADMLKTIEKKFEIEKSKQVFTVSTKDTMEQKKEMKMVRVCETSLEGICVTSPPNAVYNFLF